MAFSSLVFVFLFLPITLIINRTLLNRNMLRNIVLLALSLLFYAWGDLKNLPIFILSVLFNYFAGKAISAFNHENRETEKRVMMIVAAGTDILMLVLFKYTSLVMPLGVSFYTFSALSYIFDVYYGRVNEDENVLTVCLYILFFPKVISGPIMQYKDFASQVENPSISKSRFFAGAHLFMMGLFKKMLLADNLGNAFNSIHELNQMAGLTAWLGMILYALQLYFDFSGYSDMAIGLANMLGFKMSKNFNYPYMSDGVIDFWRRWHISLGAWFRDYVYIPIGGNRCSREKQIRNLAIVWIITGIWHGNTWNFVIWGIWHGIFVILEKFVIKEKRNVLPRPVRIILTNFVVFVGWIMFFSPTLKDALHFVAEMFGADGLGFINSGTMYELLQNLILIVAALVFAGPLPMKIENRFIAKGGQAQRIIATAIYIILFIFCIANMVGTTYSSFLYFRF